MDPAHGGRRPAERLPAPAARQPYLDLRLGQRLFDQVQAHVEDFSDGEQAGFLLCRSSRSTRGETLLGIAYAPVPEEDVTGRDDAYGLSWSAAFNATAIEWADQMGGSLVLVHSHGRRAPVRLSPDDRRNGAELVPSLSRLLDGRTCATLVLGDRCIDSLAWRAGRPCTALRRISVIGDHISWWPAKRAARAFVSARHDRQQRALGEERQRLLAQARVAVVGCSGGGSHVCQQLTHAGIGTIIPIDDELVEDVNLGRMVGSTPADVDQWLKVDVMERLIASIDPNVRCEPVPHRFPAKRVLDALRSADVVVCCVDSFYGREQLATFGRRHLLPMVDIGMSIETEGGVLRSADGQLVVTGPDSSCLRCTPLLSDALLERERRERPPGYDRNPLAGDPQVVSMNGTLASEACNCVLDLLTGFSDGARGPGWWGYNARTGTLSRSPLPSPWAGCPACAEFGAGDRPQPRVPSHSIAGIGTAATDT